MRLRTGNIWSIKTLKQFTQSLLNFMTATLELPVDLAVSVLRKAGTGDNLLAALDALVSYETQVQDEVDAEPIEWQNAVNLEDETENVTDEVVVDF